MEKNGGEWRTAKQCKDLGTYLTPRPIQSGEIFSVSNYSNSVWNLWAATQRCSARNNIVGIPYIRSGDRAAGSAPARANDIANARARTRTHTHTHALISLKSKPPTCIYTPHCEFFQSDHFSRAKPAQPVSTAYEIHNYYHNIILMFSLLKHCERISSKID